MSVTCLVLHVERRGGSPLISELAKHTIVLCDGTKRAAGIADGDGTSWYVARHYATRADDCAVTDRHAS